jgi:hypothetical protein
MMLPEEETMSSRRIESKSGAIELNDEQLKSLTGGRKCSDAPVRYMEFKLKEVLISSIQTSEP